MSNLPYPMRDTTNMAIEECINKALDVDMSKILLCVADNLTESVLYERAKMMHVLGTEGWQNCKTREDKISLLKNSIRNHRFKGTVHSIKTALTKYTVEYLHWKDFGGVSNHFKLRVFTENSLPVEEQEQIAKSVLEYKRHSAKLDAIEYSTLQKDDLCLNTTLLLSRRILTGI